MVRGRSLPTLALTEEERATLRGCALRRKTAQALALRSRIALRASAGLTATAIASELSVCIQTVSKWWRRYHVSGPDGLLDEPRPGQPRKLTDLQVEQVIVRTLESEPAGATHWSTRSMAQATGLNQTAISRIWRAFALQPPRQENFKLSRDPLFIDKVRDRALVLCVDEKSRFRHWNAPLPCCPCARDRPNAAPTTT
jgi:transposase